MELRHLRYFLAAAEEESFGRASERMHVTRPAISQVIANLEAELGARLFTRVARGVRLNEAGRTLVPELRRIMAELDQAFETATRVSRAAQRRLVVGHGTQALMHSMFAAAVVAYRKAFPEVSVTLVEVPCTEQPRLLAQGRIDVAFTQFGPARPLPAKELRGATAQREPVDDDFEWMALDTSRVGAIVADTHPLARRHTVTLAELADESFIDLTQSSLSLKHGPLPGLCVKSGFQPRIVQEVDSTSVQLSLVGAGMGIALGVGGAGFSYPQGMRAVPIMSLNHRATFAFGWVKERETPTVARMAQTLREMSASKGGSGPPVAIIRPKSSIAG